MNSLSKLLTGFSELSSLKRFDFNPHIAGIKYIYFDDVSYSWLCVPASIEIDRSDFIKVDDLAKQTQEEIKTHLIDDFL